VSAEAIGQQPERRRHMHQRPPHCTAPIVSLTALCCKPSPCSRSFTDEIPYCGVLDFVLEAQRSWRFLGCLVLIIATAENPEDSIAIKEITKVSVIDSG
jgi:hypothetical protein